MTKKARKKSEEKKGPVPKLPELTFTTLLDQMLMQLRAILLRSYSRRDAGVFKFGTGGLKVMATELLDQATEFQGFFSASSYSLSAALFGLGAYNLELEKSPPKKRSTTRKKKEKDHVA